MIYMYSALITYLNKCKAKVDNPMFQVARMLELPRVYSLYYDKPFRPPKKVLQILNSVHQDKDKDCKPGVMI